MQLNVKTENFPECYRRHSLSQQYTTTQFLMFSSSVFFTSVDKKLKWGLKYKLIFFVKLSLKYQQQSRRMPYSKPKKKNYTILIRKAEHLMKWQRIDNRKLCPYEDWAR